MSHPMSDQKTPDTGNLRILLKINGFNPVRHSVFYSTLISSKNAFFSMFSIFRVKSQEMKFAHFKGLPYCRKFSRLYYFTSIIRYYYYYFRESIFASSNFLRFLYFGFCDFYLEISRFIAFWWYFQQP